MDRRSTLSLVRWEIEIESLYLVLGRSVLSLRATLLVKLRGIR